MQWDNMSDYYLPFCVPYRNCTRKSSDELLYFCCTSDGRLLSIIWNSTYSTPINTVKNCDIFTRVLLHTNCVFWFVYARCTRNKQRKFLFLSNNFSWVPFWTVWQSHRSVLMKIMCTNRVSIDYSLTPFVRASIYKAKYRVDIVCGILSIIIGSCVWVSFVSKLLHQSFAIGDWNVSFSVDHQESNESLVAGYDAGAAIVTAVQQS